MNRKLYIIFALIALLFSGCYRDELCYLHPTGARILLVADYDSAGLVPDKSYVGIYNATDGRLLREELMRTPTQHDISLDVGRYHLLVYNEPIMEEDFTTTNSTDFSNQELWHTWKTFAVDDQLPVAGNKSRRTTLAIQEQLAVARLMNFEVTSGMISLRHIHPTPIEEANRELPIDTTLCFHPLRVFTKVFINMQINHYSGWVLRRNNGNRPWFYGASETFFMGTDSYAGVPTTQYVDFVNAGNRYDNLIPATHFRATYYMIGMQGDVMPDLQNGYPYELFLRFEYGSSTSPGGLEIRPMTIDLAAATHADRSVMTHTRAGDRRPADGKTYYNDVLDIEFRLTLPERLPIGEDADIDLEDWDEQDVPLNGLSVLNFYPNGATGNMFNWRYYAGALVFMPVPTSFVPRDGYHFKEWNTKSDGTGQDFAPGAPYRIPSGGSHLFAIWEKI